MKGKDITMLRLFGTVNDSIVDGPGIRYAVFVQGCPHNCDGCHNPKSHDINGGYFLSIENILEKIKKNPLLDGVTFSGGEPFLQAKELSELAKSVHKMGLNIFTYTGYKIEELLAGANEENSWFELIKNSDYIVDGKFIKELKSYDLIFKGSSNQRIIDVKQTLKTNQIVEYKQ